MTAFIILAASIVSGVLGQFFFKWGINQHQGEAALSFKYYAELAGNLWIYLGALSYGISFLLWMLVLKFYELSWARPLTSIGYILTYLLAVLFLNEAFTLRRGLAIVLITGGVLLMK